VAASQPILHLLQHNEITGIAQDSTTREESSLGIIFVRVVVDDASPAFAGDMADFS
jgi:hypothetical protein